MNAAQESTLLRTAVALGAAGACLALLFTLDGSRAVGASTRAEAVACTLVSTSKLESTLALPQVNVVRNSESTTAVSPGTDAECAVGLWAGAPPMSRTAVAQALKSGHAAYVGIETWAPNTGSPNVTRWPAEFAELVAEFKKGATDFPGVFTHAGWPSKAFKPTHLGHPTVGFTFAMQKTFKGVLTAVACWWDMKTRSAICVLDEEATFRPVVQHLDQIAAVAVPKFLG